MRFTGSREEFQPKGFKGALMRCQKSERDGRRQYPFCVWSDYSTVAVTVHYGTFEEQERGEFMPLSELAELTAKLYNTSRTKV